MNKSSSNSTSLWLMFVSLSSLGCGDPSSANVSTLNPPAGTLLSRDGVPISHEIGTLEGVTLKEIGNAKSARLACVFGESTVEITYKDGPIPPDIVMDILGNDQIPQKITASWTMIDRDTKLRLFDIRIDDEYTDHECTLPIAAAGLLRVNWGSRQYNLFRNVPASSTP